MPSNKLLLLKNIEIATIQTLRLSLWAAWVITNYSKIPSKSNNAALLMITLIQNVFYGFYFILLTHAFLKQFSLSSRAMQNLESEITLSRQKFLFFYQK